MNDLEVIKRIIELLSTEIVNIKEKPRNYNAYLLDANDYVVKLNLSTSCSQSKLSALIDLLVKLNNLTELNLNNNDLSDLTKLSELKNLKVLSLYNNKISDLSFIESITNLVILDVSSNPLNHISSLECLTKLTNLQLYNCNLVDITSLKNMITLKVLNLSKNKITDLSALKKLKNIVFLDLYSNQLDDITLLSKLTNLTTLNLSKNNLYNLEPLRNLSSLKRLDLRKNRLRDISVLKEMNNLTDLDVYGNPIINPPPEILSQGIKAIQNYLRSFDVVKDEIPINEVKVLFVGDGGAGKTSLIKRILHDQFYKGELQTKGINIDTGINVDDWDFSTNETCIKAHFWDFGGQEIMHHTHQFFLSKRSIYVLVLDGRKDEKSEYWLKLIESFGGKSPILIVINKIDENPGHEINRKFLKEKYKAIRGFHRISCANNVGISEFKRALKNELAVIEHIKTTWAKSWFEVKQELEKFNEDYISCDKFEEICIRHKILDESSQETLVNFLNDLGIVLHFNDSTLQETNVINPAWLTEAAYKILNSEELADKKGVLDINFLDVLLDNETYPKRKHRFIIDIMKKFELCYSVDDQTILVPNLTKVDEPNFKYDYDSALKFIFDYEEFLPFSIIPRFIVKMHEDITTDVLCWRTGVVLNDTAYKSTAVIKADYSANKINVWVKGSQQRDYFSIIRHNLRSINKSFKKLSVIELVPLPDTDRSVEYEVLIGLEEMGDEYYTDGKLRLKYNVKELLSGIETELNRTIMEALNEIRDNQKQMFLRQEDVSILWELMLSKQTDISQLIKELMNVKPNEETFVEGLFAAVKIEPNFYGLGVDLKKLFRVIYKKYFK